VAVTGAGGWIGSEVVRRLIDRGLDVVCLHRVTSGDEVAAAAASAAVVIHAGAAYSNDRSDFIDGALGQTVAVARGCSKVRNTVIFLSSVKVYGWANGGGGGGGEDGGPRDEGAPVRISDNFAAAKRLGEQILERAAHRSLVLRISNVYGRGVPDKYAFGAMIEAARHARPLTLNCTGESRRDFVHFDDVVAAVEAAAVAALGEPVDGPGQEIYNVASGRLVSLMDVARLFGQVLGCGIVARGGDPVSSPAFANRKVIEAGFIERFTDPLVGIRSVIEEWRDRPWTR
jgi:nucleoside-diphosphate-sugar epimerase